jgi:predicted small lipoprotein YifL
VQEAGYNKRMFKIIIASLLAATALAGCSQGGVEVEVPYSQRQPVGEQAKPAKEKPSTGSRPSNPVR